MIDTCKQTISGSLRNTVISHPSLEENLFEWGNNSIQITPAHKGKGKQAPKKSGDQLGDKSSWGSIIVRKMWDHRIQDPRPFLAKNGIT